jgi:hypothetical protein
MKESAGEARENSSLQAPKTSTMRPQSKISNLPIQIQVKFLSGRRKLYTAPKNKLLF